MDLPTLTRALDAASGKYPLLEHPFYKAWAAGTLTKEDLSFYASQYWHQVDAFPGYLESVAEDVDDPKARSILESNLRDEVEGDHRGMWLDFAEALGKPAEKLHDSEAEPETRSCVRRFKTAATSHRVPFALGMLYGYESQTPRVAQTKLCGLREHYGIAGDGARYFEVHGELDVQHSAEMAEAIGRVARSEEAARDATSGAEAGAKAVWALLDGVVRVRELMPVG